MIVMLLSVVWGRIQERTRNFGDLVHETWPRTYVRSVFKFYKKQTTYENHETCWDVVISYVEAMIKIWEDFVHVVTYDAYKLGHLHMWYLMSMIFGLCLFFIEFKNTSHASLRSCFVSKMSEISGPFLDTTTHYTQ